MFKNSFGIVDSFGWL